MKALVLSGGGAKGTYQIGVMKALKELKFEPEIVTGTSIGSINGALYVQGGYKKVIDFWNSTKITDLVKLENTNLFNIDNEKVKMKMSLLYEIIKNNGLDYEPFLKKIKSVIDEKKIRKSSKEFGLITVNLSSLKPLILYKENIENGLISNYIMASCACFPTMKMHKIGNELFIDGAYYDNMPIEQAIEKGATEIVAVNLKAVGIYRKPKEKNVKLISIEPKKSLGDFVLFDKESIKQNIKLGYIDTMKAFEKLDGEDFAFKCDSIDELLKEYDQLIKQELSLLLNNDVKEKSNIIKTMNSIGFKDAYKKMKDEYEKNSRKILINILEIIFKELEKDEYDIYSKFMIKRAIKQNYKPEMIDEIEREVEKLFKLDKKENIKEESIEQKVKKILEKIDNENLINYILKLLEDEDSERNRVELKLFSTFAKNELMAAILIKVIRNKSIY